MHIFTDTPCGRALTQCEADLDRSLSPGEMVDFLLDNFSEIANVDEAKQIRDCVLLGDEEPYQRGQELEDE